jgi:hypothetical protein
MIIAERKKNSVNRLDEFGAEMKDGRLTQPSDGTIYNLREAILTSKRLGRPLTIEEMARFEV